MKIECAHCGKELGVEPDTIYVVLCRTFQINPETLCGHCAFAELMNQGFAGLAHERDQ